MKRACAHCHSRRFGLVRYYLITFSGQLVFCKKRCKDDYAKDVMQRVRKKQFLKWLTEERSRS